MPRAVMSQQPDLHFPLTVEEVVMMGRYPHFSFAPGKKDIQICTDVLRQMKLDDFAGRNYLTLSGGEKQRVQFARVLAQIWEPPASGNRYLFLREGRLIAQGPPSAILNASLIEDIFRVKVAVIENPLTKIPVMIYP